MLRSKSRGKQFTRWPQATQNAGDAPKGALYLGPAGPHALAPTCLSADLFRAFYSKGVLWARLLSPSVLLSTFAPAVPCAARCPPSSAACRPLLSRWTVDVWPVGAPRPVCSSTCRFSCPGSREPAPSQPLSQPGSPVLGSRVKAGVKAGETAQGSWDNLGGGLNDILPQLSVLSPPLRLAVPWRPPPRGVLGDPTESVGLGGWCVLGSRDGETGRPPVMGSGAFWEPCGCT